jgi:hypothetical protein
MDFNIFVINLASNFGRRKITKGLRVRIWQKIKFEINLFLKRDRLGALPKSLLK